MAAPRFSEVPETPRPVTRSQTTFNLSYVLPYKSRDKADLEELTAYLRWMGQRAEVIIVDGSLAASWQEHHRRWQSPLLHIEPRADLRYLNGKVNGVITGVERATYDKVIVADDDVRYDDDSLLQMESSLEEADVVRPQNYFIGNPQRRQQSCGDRPPAGPVGAPATTFGEQDRAGDPQRENALSSHQHGEEPGRGKREEQDQAQGLSELVVGLPRSLLPEVPGVGRPPSDVEVKARA
ncbi:MAG TPA: glycosyltransferase [Actinomycetota bacterium]|nr:glycosyltransferase [Actinomycetota bacterium]